MWVTTADLPTNAGHLFFERLNRVLEEAGFDAFVEELCAAFYAARMGRPSLRPGRYFRLLSRLRNSWGLRLGAALNSPGEHPFALDCRLDAALENRRHAER